MRSLSSSTTSVASSASHSADTVKESESNIEENEKVLEPVLSMFFVISEKSLFRRSL